MQQNKDIVDLQYAYEYSRFDKESTINAMEWFSLIYITRFCIIAATAYPDYISHSTIHKDKQSN